MPEVGRRGHGWGGDTAPDSGRASGQSRGHGWGGDTAAPAGGQRRPGCRSGGLPVPGVEPGLSGTAALPADPPRRELCRQPGPPPRSPVPPAGRDTASRACRMLKGRRAEPGDGAVGGGAAGTASTPGPAPEGWPGYKFPSAQVSLGVGYLLRTCPEPTRRQGSCSRPGHLS